MLRQRFDRLQRLRGPRPPPIDPQLEAMQLAPFANETQRAIRETSGVHLERVDRDRRAMLAVAGMEVWAAVDLLVAAVADRYDLAVLHYDHDYDLIADKTGLSFTSEWLVPHGTI